MNIIHVQSYTHIRLSPLISQLFINTKATIVNDPKYAFPINTTQKMNIIPHSWVPRIKFLHLFYKIRKPS